MISSYISFSSIKDRTNTVYHKRFGSIFGEFKNNKGFFSTQYYAIFFLRRLAYLLSQVYLNNYLYVQYGINVVFSIVQISHLVYYLPFRETHIFISVLCGEIGVAIFLGSSVVFLEDISTETIVIFESIMIYSIIGTMAVQFLVSTYSMFLVLKLLWKKVLKYKALEFIKANQTISTDMNSIVLS